MLKHHYVTSADLFTLHCQPESNLYYNSNFSDDDTETLLDATKEVCLGVNTVKAKYMFLSYHLTAGQNQNINITNEQLRNVAKLKCFETRGTESIVTCRVVHATNKMGSSSDDWIY
jgi:hypothetical protein